MNMRGLTAKAPTGTGPATWYMRNTYGVRNAIIAIQSNSVTRPTPHRIRYRKPKLKTDSSRKKILSTIFSTEFLMAPYRIAAIMEMCRFYQEKIEERILLDAPVFS